MSKIMYIPLDERPCNYQYPKAILSISDIEMLRPPMEILGNKKKPADTDKLLAWIKENVSTVDYLVISIDMLLHGGIVPSRLHKKSFNECEKDLSEISELKKINPKLKILAFNLIMRAPSYNSSDEEPDYYENYGRKLFEYGVNKDKFELNVDKDLSKQEMEKIKAEIPSEILKDFITRRDVNHKVNLEAIDLVHSSVIDFLIIPMDDCALYSYSANDRRKLLKHIYDLDLMDRIYSYPGADEVGCTLIARAFNEIKNIKPKVFLKYASEIGKNLIPVYEDRSLNETVKYQVIAAGGCICDNSSDSDFLLCINPPSNITLKMADSWQSILNKEDVDDPERNLNEFADSINDYINKGKHCAVADVSLPNGSDNKLMKLIKKYGLLKKLLSYGGWNTSSNTLGTVISHSMISSYYINKNLFTYKQKNENEKYLLLRYLEDWGYQHFVRSEVTDLLGGYKLNYFDLRDKTEMISYLISDNLSAFKEENLKEFANDFSVYMPWNRMFEVGIKIL